MASKTESVKKEKFIEIPEGTVNRLKQIDAAIEQLQQNYRENFQSLVSRKSDIVGAILDINGVPAEGAQLTEDYKIKYEE